VSGVGRAVRRIGGVLAVAVFAATVSWAYRGPYHGAVRWCCGYTPARLAAGEWWPVLGSGLLVVRPNPFGVNTALLSGLVLPYALREGSRRALRVFFAGHVAATLAVAAVVLPLAAWGWDPAETVRWHGDVGVSAGVAAVTGALAVSLHRRRLGVVVLAAPATFFAVLLVLTHTLSEVEHLIALAVGATLHRRFMAASAG
jgi:hypothetical protein